MCLTENGCMKDGWVGSEPSEGYEGLRPDINSTITEVKLNQSTSCLSLSDVNFTIVNYLQDRKNNIGLSCGRGAVEPTSVALLTL